MNIVFVGPPACGKGTQASIISEKFGLSHFSTGDILRDEAKKTTERGLLVSSILGKGDLCPSDLLEPILEEYITENSFDNILFDGYPRKLDQGVFLNKILNDNKKNIDFVFFFDIDDVNVVERITGRLACSTCGEIYNTTTMPPKIANICDECGSKLAARGDDSKEIMMNRLKKYHAETFPLKNFYAEKGVLNVVDARMSVHEVTDYMLNIIKGDC